MNFVSRSLLPVVCSLTVSICGCGVVATGKAPEKPVEYHADGDSITRGDTLEDPATQAYPALVAAYAKIPLENYALGGDQACDIPKLQIFRSSDSPSVAKLVEYSVLIGTNDADVYGPGAYEAVFRTCHQAVVSWLGVPLELKVLATSPSVETSGPGAIDATNNWMSWTTEGLGSSVSFSITLSAAGSIYAWLRIDSKNDTTYSYALDGNVLGSASVAPAHVINTQKGTSDSLGFLRIPDVAAGKHVVT